MCEAAAKEVLAFLTGGLGETGKTQSCLLSGKEVRRSMMMLWACDSAEFPLCWDVGSRSSELSRVTSQMSDPGVS